MKSIKNIVRNLCRPVALTVLGVTLLAQTTQAATIKFEAKVPGYSRGTGWALVVNGAPKGMVWHPELNCYVTDRVQRGEKIRITISPNTAAERCQKIALAGAYSDAGPLSWLFVSLPFVCTGTVPTSPNQDNVFICAYTTLLTNPKYTERRIHIGTR